MVSPVEERKDIISFITEEMVDDYMDYIQDELRGIYTKLEERNLYVTLRDDRIELTIEYDNEEWSEDENMEDAKETVDCLIEEFPTLAVIRFFPYKQREVIVEFTYNSDYEELRAILKNIYSMSDENRLSELKWFDQNWKNELIRNLYMFYKKDMTDEVNRLYKKLIGLIRGDEKYSEIELNSLQTDFEHH